MTALLAVAMFPPCGVSDFCEEKNAQKPVNRIGLEVSRGIELKERHERTIKVLVHRGYDLKWTISHAEGTTLCADLEMPLTTTLRWTLKGLLKTSL